MVNNVSISLFFHMCFPTLIVRIILAKMKEIANPIIFLKVNNLSVLTLDASRNNPQCIAYTNIVSIESGCFQQNHIVIERLLFKL